MKKLLVILLTLAVCFIFFACGSKDSDDAGKTDNPEVESTEEAKEENDTQVKSIDLTVDKGSIKFIGFEKANPGLVDEENVIVIKFEYTNNQDLPSQSQSTFRIQTYQNGTEITDSLSYSSNGGDQYELIGNYFSEAMKGGTVTFGRMVKLKDNSPLTIMVKENGVANGKYQMMELDVSNNSSSDNSDTKAEVETTKETTTEKAVAQLWNTDYYVDDFNQPTDEWYIMNNTLFIGTFSNSAVTDAKLTAEILVDCNKEISFFLYEYGRNLVKNSSENYVDTYNITMRTADGKDHKITGTLYCGGDRIYVDSQYTDTVLKALKGDENVMFRFVKSDRTVENYLINVIPANFASEYKTQTAK